ncbi:MAG: efflux RND transporter periplasmic adaptor subunit [Proteobacteria bacterium]|nr:efflux RND transporter periplasmic adaptor subunit [Pseudomonadota bacterium]
MSDDPTPGAAPPPAGPAARRLLQAVIVVALLVAAWGIVSRVLARASLAAETAAVSVPAVTTAHPVAVAEGESLVLPGSVQPYFEAPIYARTSGYLKVWHTDIGTHVTKGQVLAEIDAPELDQQYAQAQADVSTAEANYRLARITDERWQGLLATESVSKQDADQRAGDAAAKQAALQSATANLARLRELESFKQVRAPFDGVVTMRNTDIGALINAGQSAGGALFRVSDTHRLRIYVAVPEPYAAAMVAGLPAELAFAEHPGRHFPAKVVYTAHALDPAMRTLQVELQVDNAGGELLPGAYAEVHFQVAAGAVAPRVPVNALIFRSGGLMVATVGADHRVSLRKIVAGRDFGTEIEVRSGLGPGDEVVVNPPDSLIDGVEVRVVPPPAAPGGR